MFNKIIVKSHLLTELESMENWMRFKPHKSEQEIICSDWNDIE